jgi:hypothetical protein
MQKKTFASVACFARHRPRWSREGRKGGEENWTTAFTGSISVG